MEKLLRVQLRDIPGVHEFMRENHNNNNNIWIFIITVLIPKYMIAVVKHM